MSPWGCRSSAFGRNGLTEVFDELLERNFLFIPLEMPDGADAALLALLVEEHDVGNALLHGVLRLLVDLTVFQEDFARHARAAQVRRQLEAVRTHVRVHLEDQNLGRGLRTGLRLDHAVLLERREQPGQPDGDADARQLTVDERACQVVEPASRADAADALVVHEHGLVHRAGVVIETARDAEIDGEAVVGDAQRTHVADHFREFGHALREQVTVLAGLEPLESRGRRILERQHFEESGELFLGNTDMVAEVLFGLLQTVLLHLVDQRQRVALSFHRSLPVRPGLCFTAFDVVQRDAQMVEEAVMDLAIVEADDELAHLQFREDAVDNGGHLRVVQKAEIAVADDVDITLVELAEAAFLRTFPAPDLLDLVAAEREVQFAVVLGHVAGERHSEVEVEREALVRFSVRLVAAFEQVDAVDLLGVLPGLAEEDVRALDGGHFNRHEAEQLVVLGNDALHALELDLLLRQEFFEAGNGFRGNQHVRFSCELEVEEIQTFLNVHRGVLAGKHGFLRHAGDLDFLLAPDEREAVGHPAGAVDRNDHFHRMLVLEQAFVHLQQVRCFDERAGSAAANDYGVEQLAEYAALVAPSAVPVVRIDAHGEVQFLENVVFVHGGLGEDANRLEIHLLRHFHGGLGESKAGSPRQHGDAIVPKDVESAADDPLLPLLLHLFVLRMQGVVA